MRKTEPNQSMQKWGGILIIEIEINMIKLRAHQTVFEWRNVFEDI